MEFSREVALVLETQISLAREGMVTEAVRAVAEQEGLAPEELAQLVADGKAVVLAGKKPGGNPVGIGERLRVKVNANLGISSSRPDIQQELEKLRVAERAGADTVMDLSTGPVELVAEARRRILEASSVPVGTVPVYEAAMRAIANRGAVVKMTIEDLFRCIEDHAASGVAFVTVHCGLTSRALEALRRVGRVASVVSRGGAFLVAWMLHNERENPLYEHYDRLLEVARRYDLILSLGDGMRPGCLADAGDVPQMQELVVLGELVARAWEYGVQVMVEGPGHVPLDQVAAQVAVQKSTCRGAPFYVLGPLVTDSALGFDHIATAIGGAVAAMAGADFLCYVTPAEHLGLPTLHDVYEGVMAARVAAHAADLARRRTSAWQRDLRMARARAALDWDQQVSLALDPERARTLLAERSEVRAGSECSMCGRYCALKMVRDYLGGEREREGAGFSCRG